MRQPLIWQPIPERGPRAVRPSRNMIVGKWAIPIVFAMLTIGGWIVSNNTVARLRLLSTKGVRTEASVVSKHYTSERSTTYYLDYFFLGNLEGISDDVSVPHSEYDDTNVGDRLTVTYLPADPHVHMVGPVTDDTIRSTQFGWQLGLAGLTAFSALMYYLLLSNHTKQQTLLREGIACQATVTSTELRRAGRTTTNRIEFCYNRPTGDRAEGVASAGAGPAFAIRQGDQMPFLYLEGSERGQLMPFLRLVELDPGKAGNG